MANIQFDTSVQELKYKVLKEMARSAYSDTLLEDFYNIPKIISPGPKSTMRCCIYKERAIVQERMKLAMGGNKEIDNVIEVIKVACDECPLGGYEVTNRCRGCIAHRCQKACRKGAIHFDETTRAAVIDKNKCVNCGMCAKACQYNAIMNYERPCVEACSVKAISEDEDHAAKIDDEKCVQCGACVYQCPFGAIIDKSSIVDAVKTLKENEISKNHPIYAIVAPSIASQFSYAKLGQVVTAIKQLGFDKVIEAALGADMVASSEAKDLEEKGFLTSSCCPTFVSLIKKYYPTLSDKISHNLSPMATIAKWVKEREPKSKIIFIGPCISKKMEIKDEIVSKYVDMALTFEELQAMIDAREIEVEKLGETAMDDASYYGRVFARSGGLAEAVMEALKEEGSSFEAKPISVDGLANCRAILAKSKSGGCEWNFIEGMGCAGGCVGGPCSLSHEARDRALIDKHAKSSVKPTIEGSIGSLLDSTK